MVLLKCCCIVVCQTNGIQCVRNVSCCSEFYGAQWSLKVLSEKTPASCVLSQDSINSKVDLHLPLTCTRRWWCTFTHDGFGCMEFLTSVFFKGLKTSTESPQTSCCASSEKRQSPKRYLNVSAMLFTKMIWNETKMWQYHTVVNQACQHQVYPTKKRKSFLRDSQTGKQKNLGFPTVCSTT